MSRGLFLLTLLVARVATAEEHHPLHVYYYSGESIEQMKLEGVTVTVSLKDTGKLNQVAVYVDNSSGDAVNVIPANFRLHESTPKDADLAMKSEQEVQKIIGRRPVWGQVGSGVATGITRARDKMAGKEDEPVVKAPTDYDAQARWLAHADELGQRGHTNTLGHVYLRGSTVFPGSKFAGLLWFDRSDAFASGMVRITLGSRNYEFPFPPPEWATTPSSPNQPDKEAAKPSSVRSSDHPSGDPASGNPETGGSSSKTGVLGVSGENWAEGGMAGVKILEVNQNSAAELAGLRAGFVITELDARRIGSTEDLAAILARRGPGSRVTIDYLFRSNLGWMPKQTVVILGGGD